MTCRHALIWAVDLCNIFVCKHLQISMLMIPIGFLSNGFRTLDMTSYFPLAFSCKTLGRRGAIMWVFFMCSKRGILVCRVLAVFMRHLIYLRIFRKHIDGKNALNLKLAKNSCEEMNSRVLNSKKFK